MVDNAQIVQEYLERVPTEDNSIEIIKEIATLYDVSPNLVRMTLIQENAYVRKAPVEKAVDKDKKPSKETAITALKDAIRETGKEVDDSILDKLTGKAAQYLLTIIKQ